MENYTLLDVFNALWRDMRFIIRWIFWTVVVVGVITLLIPKTYTSEGKVFVRLGRENSSLDATATLGERPVVAVPLMREEEINSVTEMIKNRSIYEYVVDEIGADVILKKTEFTNETPSEDTETATDTPSFIGNAVDSVMGLLTKIGVVDDVSTRERAIIRLSKDIRVEPLEKSNVIQIQFDSYHPELARQVVQLVINRYEETHVELHRTSNAFEFLEEQTGRILSSLNQCETEFEAFKNRVGILELQRNREALIDRIATTKNKKLDNDVALASVSEEIKQLENILERAPELVIVESTQGAGQEGVDAIREQFFQLELEHAQLVAKYSDNHPRVKAVTKQLEQTGKIVEMIENTRSESIKGTNKVLEEGNVELMRKRAEQSGLVKRSEEFQRQLDDLELALQDFTANETKFLRLQRDCTIGDTTYRKYANNLEQARIDHQLQQHNISNISVAQPATYSDKPSKPRKLLNLVLALFFGTVCGVGLTIWRDISRQD